MFSKIRIKAGANPRSTLSFDREVLKLQHASESLGSLALIQRGGNTCKLMAVSFQCMTKSTTNKKKNKVSRKEKKKKSF